MLQRVANHRYLFRRGSHFYFRRAVPKDVMHAFSGKAHVTVALKTDSLAQARHALARHLRDFDRALAEARALPDPTAPGLSKSRMLRVPENGEVDAVVRAWLRTQEAETVTRVLALSPDQLDESVSDLEPFERMVRESARGRKGANVQMGWLADHLAEVNAWDCAAGSPVRGYLELRLHRAQLEWARITRAEYAFDPRPQPDAYFGADYAKVDAEVLARVKDLIPVPIMGLFDDYVQERQPAAATIKAWRTSLRSLAAHLGHDDAARVSRVDLVAWKDALLQPQADGRTRSHRTVGDKYLAAANTIFGWAERNMRIAENPASKVAVAMPKKVKLRTEKGLNDVEARVILAASLVSGDDHRSPPRGRARRWVPWICAYTGARVGEITQLRGSDVFKHSSGVMCIRITPEAGGQKSNEARLVPLHPHLIEQGFLVAIHGIPGPIFFNPEAYRGGKDGNPQHKKTAERLADWVRGLGVNDDEVQPNHGWRHRFKTMGHRAGIPPGILDVLQGHTPDTEGAKYGYVPVERLYEEICKLPRYSLT